MRQGQISELINAKPKARRRILEEAAGISGLYQRRHEAELKLKGTEANLLRVDDVIEQLAAQLATLARQARQAARYRAIGEELRRAEGLLLYRRWREADEARVCRPKTRCAAATTAAARAETAAARGREAARRAEAALPPLREEEAIAARRPAAPARCSATRSPSRKSARADADRDAGRRIDQLTTTWSARRR